MPVSNILIALGSQITLEHTAYPQYFPLTENQSMFVIEFGSNQRLVSLWSSCLSWIFQNSVRNQPKQILNQHVGLKLARLATTRLWKNGSNCSELTQSPHANCNRSDFLGNSVSLCFKTPTNWDLRSKGTVQLNI